MPPLLRLDAVGWALMSVASTISTSGSGASGSPGESGGSGASDADNSEKISAKTPLSHQRRQMPSTCSVLSPNNRAITQYDES